MAPEIFGTREWSVASVNCLIGCSHDCRYCYARADALRFGRISSSREWRYPKIREGELRKPRKRVEGTIMFPTTHDILPEFLEPCLHVIYTLLAVGNRLLIVSKAHLECIEAICREHQNRRDQIHIRFTIGALDDDLLSFWEPGAPPFQQRYDSLILARKAGFATSVSCEPLLDADRMIDLFRAIEPLVTDTIWIGKANRLRTRCMPGTSEERIRRVEAGQTDEWVREIYQALKGEPKVRWKESYKRVLGLEPAPRAGMDL